MIWPSLKWIESMKPDTRARTSTVSTAAKRPVYSSHSVILFCSGVATVTDGGGPDLATGAPSQPATRYATGSKRQPRTDHVILRNLRLSRGSTNARCSACRLAVRTVDHIEL